MTAHRSVSSRLQRGLALPIVLWVAILLTVIAGSLTTSLRTDTAQAGNHLHYAQALALAEGGIWSAVADLLRPPLDRRWRSDGTHRTIAVGGHPVRVWVEDEGGRIDLNTGRRELLVNLLSNAGVATAQGLAMVDALTAARESTPAGGTPQMGRQGPFNTVEDVLDFTGMTPELYRMISPALTIHSQQAAVRPEAAPLPVLLAVPGITAAEAARIIASRGQAGGSTAASFSTLARPYLALGGQSMNYRIISESIVGGVRAGITAMVHIRADGGRPFAILEWREGALFPEAEG